MSHIATLAQAARSFIVLQRRIAAAGPKGPRYMPTLSFLDQQRATIEAEIQLAEDALRLVSAGAAAPSSTPAGLAAKRPGRDER